MANMPPKKSSLKDIDFSFYFSHYLGLLWRAKWYIIGTGPIVFGLLAFYILTSMDLRPSLPVTIVIGLDNPKNTSAVNEVSIVGANKARFIQSRRFLSVVVDTMNLRLQLQHTARWQIFDSLRVDSTAAMGNYDFEIHQENQTYQLTYSNLQTGFVDKIIKQGRLVTLDTINVPGIHIRFADHYLENPTGFSFRIVSSRSAISSLRNAMYVNGPNRDEFQFSVTLQGKDYQLLTETINTMADLFVFQNIDFRNRRTNEALSVLEQQKNQAAKEMEASKRRLQGYLQANPSVGLSNNTQQTIGELMQIETREYEDKNAFEEAMKLKEQFASSSSEDKITPIREMLLFLKLQNIASAAVMEVKLQELLREKEQIEQTYSSNHPLVEKNKQAIIDLGVKAHEEITEYVKKLRQKAQSRQQASKSLNTKLQGLPLKEMRLAELQRQHDINAQIHSNIMMRYNEARIANAVEVSDVYVLDYAIVPSAPSKLMSAVQKLFYALMIALAVAFGPVILLDLIDKTARSKQELQKLIDIPLIEVVPEIVLAKEKKKQLKAKQKSKEKKKRELDPKLLNEENSRNYITEIFRSLRTKMLYLLHTAEHKTVVITSLNMDEGKSTISSNIAISLAQKNLRTLLIDADLRRGVLHNAFLKKKKPGLTDFICNNKPIDAPNLVDVIQKTHVENLHLLSAGTNVPNPQEILAGVRFEQLIAFLKNEFECIIIDSPPLAATTDCVVMAPLVAGYTIIARSGKTNIVQLRKKIEEFPEMKQKVSGIILNRTAANRANIYARYANYYY